MPGLPFRRGRGQTRTAYQQSRNAVSALGQVESFSTYVGTWLAGITIGVVLILLIPVVGIFSSERMQPAASATSDRNGSALVGNQPISQREALAKEGYQIFDKTGCTACHKLGGYAIEGNGPRLVYSGNARDSSYIHDIVRWGYNPMPAYPEKATPAQIDLGLLELSSTDLYKIVVYLQYAYDNRSAKPDWVTK